MGTCDLPVIKWQVLGLAFSTAIFRTLPIWYIGLLYVVNTFCMVLFLKNVEKYGKTAVFPGGYGWIGVCRVKAIIKIFATKTGKSISFVSVLMK